MSAADLLAAVMKDLAPKDHAEHSGQKSKSKRRKEKLEDMPEDEDFLSLLSAVPVPAIPVRAAPAYDDDQPEGDEEEFADTAAAPGERGVHVRFDDAAEEDEDEEEVVQAQPEPVDMAHEQEHMKNPFGASNQKYWAQRYRLFSRFDEGVWMDRGMHITMSGEAAFITCG